VAAVLSVAISIIVLLVPDRWGVAMSITVAVITGFIIGLTVGAVIAGLVLMEHPRRWVVCLRLPEELHRRLSEDATDHMCSLKAEIINRLQASFDQPNGDQVVDAPRL
jgi:Arc-like DNA binding domain